MTIGIPIDFAFQGSNVEDDTPTIKDLEYGCSAPVIDKGKEVQGDMWIWSYRGKKDYVVPTWSSTEAEKGSYEIGDVLFKDCKTIKITGKKGSGIFEKTRPLEPEDYSGWDKPTHDILDYTKFTHRYFRVKNSVSGSNKNLSRTFRSPSGISHYSMLWDTCRIYGCKSKAGWIWYSHPIPFNRCINTCLNKGYSSKYDSSTDIKASFGSCWGEKVIRFNSVIERNGYFYFRTHLNKKIEYGTWRTGTKYDYTYSRVTTPADIEGFVKKRMVNALSPFDGKNYTAAKAIMNGGVARWVVTAKDNFDSIGFGRTLCDKITVTATNNKGEVIGKITGYDIDNRLAVTSKREYPSTAILYFGREDDGTVKLMPAGTVVTIEVYGENELEVGEIVGGETLDAGFTKVQFQNKIKDFSPKEQDKWGNWDYNEEGVRVSVHSGVVDFPIASYDGINRLMLLIGGRKVLINSSDTLGNEQPDGHRVFSATMMIARFLTLTLATSEKNKKIGDIAKYNFTVEEIV